MIKQHNKSVHSGFSKRQHGVAGSSLRDHLPRSLLPVFERYSDRPGNLSVCQRQSGNSFSFHQKENDKNPQTRRACPSPLLWSRIGSVGEREKDHYPAACYVGYFPSHFQHPQRPSQYVVDDSPGYDKEGDQRQDHPDRPQQRRI